MKPKLFTIFVIASLVVSPVRISGMGAKKEVEDKEDESSALHLTSNSGDSFHASRQKTKLHALFRSNSADQCFELKARAPPLI